MTTQRDYYDILGVERGATDADLKKAFRKLAQQWHPDVNRDEGADERFKEINEAYQVLSDPQRRQAYDMFGRAGSAGGGFDPGAQQGFGGFSDLFDAFFGGSAAGGGGVRRGRPAVGSDLRYDLRITFEESIRGTEKEIEFAAPRPLRHLLGQRGEERDRHRRPAPSATAAARSATSARRCSARWSTSSPARAAAARARSSSRRARTAAARAGGSARSGSAWRSRPASTRATRSGSRPRARSGRAAARRGASTSPSTWPPTRACGARAPSSTTSSTSRSPRRRSGRRSASRRPTARRSSRSSPAPSRGPRSACAAAGRRTCGGPARAATSTSSST